jgi:hypothetical protein
MNHKTAGVISMEKEGTARMKIMVHSEFRFKYLRTLSAAVNIIHFIVQESIKFSNNK